MIVYYPHINPDDPEYQVLQAQLDPDITLYVGKDRPPTYDYLVEGRPSRENILASPDLKAVLIPWAGLPQVTRDLMREFPHVAVHNLHHNAVITAEMMMALLLSAAKFIIPVDRDFRQHNWTVRYQDEKREVLLDGKTVLILGYGAIGQKVARMCRGFDMTVLATRRSTGAVYSDGIADEIHPASALSELLPRVNVLMICLPLTPETENLIGMTELRLLPSHAILINVGRGPIVNEADFYQALRDETLYAAGSDVWYRYPENSEASSNTPPSAHPFHELDNIVMSPHRAGGSMETPQRRMQALADLLNAGARGESLPNRVNLDDGY